MVKPINKHNFAMKNAAKGMAINFYNGTSVATGYVVKQTGTNKFICTDGVNTSKPLKLAPLTTWATDLTNHQGHCTIQVETISAGTGATFAPHYAIDTAPTGSGGIPSGGTGYATNNVLTVTGGTGTAATLTVSAVTGGVITAVTLTTAGDLTSLPANPVSVTGGAGTGAKFNLTYKVLSVTVTAAGTGYATAQPLVFNGMKATTHPTATVTAGAGPVTAVSVATPGVGITVAATSVSIGGVIEHVARIWDSKCKTTEGHTVKWNLNNSVNGSAVIQGYNY